MWFGLLGPLVVDVGGTLRPVAAPKQRVILAALLLSPGRVVSIDELVDAAWETQPPSDARKTLQSYVMRLRRALGERAGARLVSRSPGYRIEAADDEVDLRVLAGGVRSARTAARAGDWAAVERHATAALAVVRGRPLEDVDSPVLRRQAPLYEDLVLDAHELRADAWARTGRAADAIMALRGLRPAHPTRESLAVRLIDALAEAGRRAEALEVYQQARRYLVDELGIEPGAELNDRHRRVLAGTEAAAGPTDLLGPLVPHELPPDLPDFIGRDAELRRLVDMLSASAGGPWLALLSGPGGVGKTSLAIHAAHRLAGQFPDGQVFVHVRGTSTAPLAAGDLLARLLRSLGTPAAEVPADPDERAASWRSRLHGRRVLIVLDDVDRADQVRAALSGAPGSMVLATSRQRLPGLAAAHRVELSGLDGDASRELFVGTAGARVGPCDADAVARVLRLCGGLPLAVRVAAAQVAADDGSTVATLAERLSDEHRRLDALTTGDLSVRSSLRVGYDNLVRHPAAGALRAALRALSLWDGPHLPAPAAAAMVGRPAVDAAPLLATLREVSLLQSGGPGRYQMHDLIRLAVRERAAIEDAPEQRHAAIRRGVAWYLCAADRAARMVRPTRRHVDPPVAADAPAFDSYDAALDWLDAELPNLVSAVYQAVEIGADTEAWQLCTTLVDVLGLRGLWADWIGTHRAALRATRALGDPFAEAWILNNISIGYSHAGQVTEALDSLTAAATLLRDTGDHKAESAVLSNLGNAYQVLGRLDTALRHYELALATYPADEPAVGTVIYRLNIGEARHLLGDHDGAVRVLTEALATDGIEETFTGVALCGLGDAYLALGRAAEAVGRYERGLAAHRRCGNRHEEVGALRRLADALDRVGRPGEAAGCRRDADRLDPAPR